MKFTDNYIKNLQPANKWFEKIESSGLGVRVKPSGNKSWFYRFTFEGKRSKMTLGKYPAVSLKEARNLLRQAQDLKEHGIHPLSHNKEKEEEERTTVTQLMKQWYTNYIEKHRKQPLQIKQHIDSDVIPLLGERFIDSLETRDITKALDKIVARGARVHANKVLSTIKQAFNYAVSRGELKLNPAAHIRARDIGGLEKPRERYLTLEEIKTIWQFLDSNHHGISLQIKNAVKILLLTGIRSGELRCATWDEFDFDNCLWTIPSEHSKIGISMRVHLAPMTKKLFLELYHCSLGNYVISGVDGKKALSDKAMPRAISRVQERVGLVHWTAHDLRRTFATQLGETLNVDPVVIEKCLGHKMPRIMATYNRNEMLPQRKEALEKWANLIESMTKE